MKTRPLKQGYRRKYVDTISRLMCVVAGDGNSDLFVRNYLRRELRDMLIEEARRM